MFKSQFIYMAACLVQCHQQPELMCRSNGAMVDPHFEFVQRSNHASFLRFVFSSPRPTTQQQAASLHHVRPPSSTPLSLPHPWHAAHWVAGHSSTRRGMGRGNQVRETSSQQSRKHPQHSTAAPKSDTPRETCRGQRR